jgi:hypothetical protein
MEAVRSYETSVNFYRDYTTLRPRELYSEIKVTYRLDPCLAQAVNRPSSSYRGGQGSIPGQVMWDLWWTKWH